jgi:hypothetical protein
MAMLEAIRVRPDPSFTDGEFYVTPLDGFSSLSPYDRPIVEPREMQVVRFTLLDAIAGRSIPGCEIVACGLPDCVPSLANAVTEARGLADFPKGLR